MTVEIPTPGSLWVHEQDNPDGQVWIRALSDSLAYPKNSSLTRFRLYDPGRDEVFR